MCNGKPLARPCMTCENPCGTCHWPLYCVQTKKFSARTRREGCHFSYRKSCSVLTTSGLRTGRVMSTALCSARPAHSMVCSSVHGHAHACISFRSWQLRDLDAENGPEICSGLPCTCKKTLAPLTGPGSKPGAL